MGKGLKRSGDPYPGSLPRGSLGLLRDTQSGGRPAPATGPDCTLGAPSRARRAGRGRGPLGGVGVDGGGGAPHPLSRFPPLRRPITKQEPAPGAASRGPATPKRRFRGKKNQSSWQRGGQWWPSRRSGSQAGPRGVPGHARVSIAIPSRARRAGRRVDRGGSEVSLRTDRAAIAGRGKGPSHPERRLCKTFGSGPGTRGQYRRTRAPQRGCSSRRLGLCPRPAGPRESSPAVRAPAGARGTYPEPRGGRAGRVGGGPGEPEGRMSGSAPARGAPRDSIVAPEPDFARP